MYLCMVPCSGLGHHAQYSQDSLQIHHAPDQDKALPLSSPTQYRPNAHN